VQNEKAKKPRLLPTCPDIENLHVVLEEKMKADDYATLAKATLCLISLFNRKREGEVQRLKLTDFDNCIAQEENGADPETPSGLSESEKKMIIIFKRIEVRGKFNRRVTILLTDNTFQGLQRLKLMRNNINPPIARSPYLFVTQAGQRPYRGCDVIKEFAQMARVSDM